MDNKITKDQLLRALKAISNVRTTLYTEVPLLYDVMDFVKIEADLSFPTMAVGSDLNIKDDEERYILKYNPLFVNGLSKPLLVGVIKHELLHILFKHVTQRFPMGVNKDLNKAKLWNIACDMTINQFIKNDLGTLGIYPDTYPYYFINEMNAEWYYEQLLGAVEKPNKTIQSVINSQLSIDDHSQWTEKEDDENNVDKENQESTLDSIRREIFENGECGNSQSGNSKDVRIKINLNSTDEMKTKLWMNKVTGSSTHGYEPITTSTRKRPNRRYGFNSPGTKREFRKNKILVAVDVSWSISRPLYNRFAAHLNNMIKHADIDIVFFNMEIKNKIQKYKREMQIDIGGGTRFSPIVALWNKDQHKNYDGLFIFTDGSAENCGNNPFISQKSVNWILYGSDRVVKTYGGHIYSMV